MSSLPFGLCFLIHVLTGFNFFSKPFLNWLVLRHALPFLLNYFKHVRAP